MEGGGGGVFPFRYVILEKEGKKLERERRTLSFIAFGFRAAVFDGTW